MTNYSVMDDQQETCRICLEEANKKEKLIRACRCNGTSKYVHRSCLQSWRETSCFTDRDTSECEICLYKYKTVKIRPFLFIRWGFNPDKDTKDVAFRYNLIVALLIILCDMFISPLDKNSVIAKQLNYNATDITSTTKSNIYMSVYGISFYVLLISYMFNGILIGYICKFPEINFYKKFYSDTLPTVSITYYLIWVIFILGSLLISHFIPVILYISMLGILILNYVTFHLHLANLLIINTTHLSVIGEYIPENDPEHINDRCQLSV